MKVLLVSNMYPSKKYPNYGVFVKNTEEILMQSDFRLHKIVMCKETNKLLKLIKYLYYYLSIIASGIFLKFDVIYVHYASHNAIPLLLLKYVKKDISIYTNVHGSDIVPESSTQEKLQKYVEKLLVISEKIITPSNYYKELVSRKYNITLEKIHVFPSGGVNGKVFYPVISKIDIFDNLGLDKNISYIGYVGRIDYKKGWDILLETLHLLKQENFMIDKKVIIVGNGRDIKLFKEKIKKYELQNIVIHYDFLTQDKLKNIYNCLDIFCFPTMREGESLGLVGLESMACGTVVIGSRIGGLMDYINDRKNGLFFTPGDYVDLKDKIKYFYSLNKLDREILKHNAIKTVEEYYSENICNVLTKIFKEKH